MGSKLTSAGSGRRQVRQRATSTIAIVAVLSLATACTAATAGAVKKAPSRYWTAAGAAASVGAAKQAPSRYWTAAGATVRTQAWAETQQSLRMEHVGKSTLSVKVVGGAPKAGTEYQALRSEHRPGAK